MSGICLRCGTAWRYHGTACQQSEPVETTWIDNTDTPEAALMRRIVREELMKIHPPIIIRVSVMDLRTPP